MITVDVFNIRREKVSQVELDDKVFDAEVKEHLFYDVIKMQLAKRRAGTAATKTRREVSGGGRKPWRQKGTGRARAGTSRSPLWKGGGTVFGPHPRDYSIQVPKKVRRAALCSALTLKRKNEKLLIVDTFELAAAKTKSFVGILSALGSKKALIIDQNNDNLRLSTRNLASVKVLPPEGLNLYDVMYFDHLFIAQPCVEAIHRRLLA